jgi:hypothetical protein
MARVRVERAVINGIKGLNLENGGHSRDDILGRNSIPLSGFSLIRGLQNAHGFHVGYSRIPIILEPLVFSLVPASATA